MKRRRPARRRFHHLQLDVLFVAAAAAALLAQAAKPLPAKVRAGSAPEAAAAPVAEFALTTAPVEPDPFFDPLPASRRDFSAAAAAAAAALPPDLAAVLPTGHALGPLRAAEAVPPELPESVARPTFPPAPAPFSEPPAPLGPVAGGRPGRGAKAEAFVFRNPGNGFPVVFVDAPGATAADVPLLEREAFELETSLPATARVVRAALPRPGLRAADAGAER